MPKTTSGSILTWLMLVACAFCNTDSLAQSLDFPVAKNGDVILVPVRLGEESYLFLVDTGAVFNAIDPSLRGRLDLNSAVAGPHQKGVVLYDSPECFLAGSKVNVTGKFILTDLASIRAVSGQQIYGILGVEFLSRFRMRYDSDGGIFSLEGTRESDAQTGMPIDLDEFGRAVCSIRFDADHVVPFVIDTGMLLPGLGEVQSPIYTQLLEMKLISPNKSLAKVQTVSEVRTVRKGQIAHFQFGNDTFRDLGVREGTFNGIGMDFLSRYNFLLDLKNRRLWTTPSKRNLAPPLFDMSGLSIVKLDNELEVVDVKPQSPAAVQMIRIGDRIVSIDGIKKDNLSLHEIRHKLAKPNVNIEIETIQNGQKRSTVLPLRNWQNANGL